MHQLSPPLIQPDTSSQSNSRMSPTQIPSRLCSCLNIKFRFCSQAFKLTYFLPPPPKVTNLLLLLSFPHILYCENHVAFLKVTRDMFIARFQSTVQGFVLLEVSAPPGTRRLSTSPAFLTVSPPYSILVFFLTAAPLYPPVSLAPLPSPVHVKL